MTRRIAWMAMTAMAVLAGAAPARAADWPQLQRDAQRTCRTTDAPPLKPTVAWTWRPSDGATLAGHVQPIVVHGLIIVGDTAGVLHALNVQTGKQKWAYRTGGVIMHTAGSDGQRVFVGSADRHFYAVNLADGSLAWRIAGEAGFLTAPAIAGDKVLAANTAGVLYCLAADSGKILWQARTDAPIRCCPTVGGSEVFIGAEDVCAYAFDLNTGKRLWKRQLPGGESFGWYWPVYSKGMVVFRTRRMYPDGPDNLVPWTLDILRKFPDTDAGYKASQLASAPTSRPIPASRASSSWTPERARSPSSPPWR